MYSYDDDDDDDVRDVLALLMCVPSPYLVVCIYVLTEYI